MLGQFSSSWPTLGFPSPPSQCKEALGQLASSYAGLCGLEPPGKLSTSIHRWVLSGCRQRGPESAQPVEDLRCAGGPSYTAAPCTVVTGCGSEC